MITTANDVVVVAGVGRTQLNYIRIVADMVGGGGLYSGELLNWISGGVAFVHLCARGLLLGRFLGCCD